MSPAMRSNFPLMRSERSGGESIRHDSPERRRHGDRPVGVRDRPGSQGEAHADLSGEHRAQLPGAAARDRFACSSPCHSVATPADWKQGEGRHHRAESRTKTPSGSPGGCREESHACSDGAAMNPSLVLTKRSFQTLALKRFHKRVARWDADGPILVRSRIHAAPGVAPSGQPVRRRSGHKVPRAGPEVSRAAAPLRARDTRQHVNRLTGRASPSSRTVSKLTVFLGMPGDDKWNARCGARIGAGNGRRCL